MTKRAPGYVELHCHSAYSFLDGASQPEELAVRAVELGYEALALTDHDGVYGSLEFAYAAKALGLRSITGAEATLADGSHVTLLVETPKGYASLCRLLTEAHAHERLNPRLDPARLAEEGEGLVCLSGCARHGFAVRDANAAADLARALGPDRFYVELQRPYERGDARRNAALRALADPRRPHGRHRRRPLPPPAPHAPPGRPRGRQEQDFPRGLRGRAPREPESVLLAPHEAAARFPDDPEAVRATVDLAERLTFDLTRSSATAIPTSPTARRPQTPSSRRSAAALSRSATATRRTRFARAPASASEKSSR